MKYQAYPQIKASKWDKNRPIHLKLGFVMAIAFALMAFNYTTYPVEENYFASGPMELIEDEILPPRTPSEPKKLPPPPTPKIETVIEVEPEDEPTFIETKTEEIFEETEKTTNIIEDEYASPKVKSPAIVAPVIEEDTPPEETIMIMADRMPVYGECSLDGNEFIRRACTNKSVMKTIYSYVKYPSIAKENEIEGTVVVSFVVDKEGLIQNLEVVRDIGGGCGKEVLNAMRKLGKFFPGKHNGRPVSVIYKLPVKFKLQ